MSINISMIPLQHVPVVWEEAATHVEGALDGNRSVEEVLQELLDDHATLWVMLDHSVLDGGQLGVMGACVTKVHTYTSRRVLYVAYCGGERMDEWLDPLLSTLENYGRDAGCAVLEMVGRRGWERTLASSGWTFPQSVGRKELSGGRKAPVERSAAHG
jgi:hypothetical protein